MNDHHEPFNEPFNEPLSDTPSRTRAVRRLERHYAGLGPTAEAVTRIQAKIDVRLDAKGGPSVRQARPRASSGHHRTLGLAWAAAVSAAVGLGLAAAALGGLGGASWFGKVKAMLPWQPPAARVAFVPFVGFRDLSRPGRFGVLDQPVTQVMTDGTRARLVQAWHEADRMIVAIALETAGGQPFDVPERVSGYQGLLTWTDKDGRLLERGDGLEGWQPGDLPESVDEAGQAPPDNVVIFTYEDLPRRIEQASLNFDLSTQRGHQLMLRRPDGRILFSPGRDVTFTLKLDRLDAGRAQREFASPRPLPELRDQHQGIIARLLDVTDGPSRTVVRVLVTYDPATVASGETPAGEISNGYSVSAEGVTHTHAFGPYIDDVVDVSPWQPAHPWASQNRGDDDWAPAAWLLDEDTGRRYAAHDEPPCHEAAQTVWMRAFQFTATDGLHLPLPGSPYGRYNEKERLWSIRQHDATYPLIDGTIINYCFDPLPRGRREIWIPSLVVKGHSFTSDWRLHWTDTALPTP